MNPHPCVHGRLPLRTAVRHRRHALGDLRVVMASGNEGTVPFDTRHRHAVGNLHATNHRWETPRVLHVMFFEPRIAGNTGNAIRLCAATGAELHLIDPLFDLSEPKLRRAGLDYHDLAHVVVHANLATGLAALGDARVIAFTTQATTRYTDLAYQDGDVLLFGPEPTGLPREVLTDPRITSQVRIPMLAARRSLNLANSAAIATYEAWRQLGFPGCV